MLRLLLARPAGTAAMGLSYELEADDSADLRKAANGMCRLLPPTVGLSLTGINRATRRSSHVCQERRKP